MKKMLLVLALLPLLAVCQSRKQRRAEEKENKIILTNLQAHVKYLADDKLQGRRTGTEGELMAMEYMSRQFSSAGLEPKGTAGYVQEFDINEGKQYEAATTWLSINGAKLKVKEDFFPLPYSADGRVEGTASLSLREKGEPWFWDVKELLEDNKANPHFDISDALKKEALSIAAKGGKALLVFNSSATEDNIQYNRFDSTAPLALPVLYISKAAAKKYIADATAIYDINLAVALVAKQRKGRNVVGFINNNAAATVIIGAHYDHLGFGEDGNALDVQGQVHNGADDNASGSAALIELAGLLSRETAKNNNYLFIAFSGEELGLFGSKYWLDHPTFEAKPNYMINLDMVGRYDTAKKLTIGGYGTSPLWGPLFTATTSTGLAIHFDSSGTGPSDHSSFYRKNIPVLFFFTNSHSDYHKATDDWDKINYAGEVAIIRYIQKIIRAADDKGKLAFLQTREQQVGAVSLPVTLGVMPDYGFTGTGMRIDGVSKGKLAERIGLKAGDVLVQLGEYKFVDVVSYMKALQHFKKGDKSKLHVIRDNKEELFDVEF
ncbi:M28 family peptidase [Foetidibacter luteolus]|uniref:M28 family peptidase n=1 Tax=Foetidibacter luteolus TaxID=2608880 RepID=UPI001A99377E|nr:M28 family peptidase [Foetidibacter luteolus]